MSASLQLQTAVYDALVNDATLSAAVGGRIFDDIEEGFDTFPYVTIGEDVLTAFDTDDRFGFDASITVHVWSGDEDTKGFAQGKTIQGLIYDVLHYTQALSLADYNVVLFRQAEAENMRDPDGLRRHGVQTFETILRRK